MFSSGGVPSEEELLAKCLELGLVMRLSDNSISHPPITLHPFPIRRKVLNELKEKQRLWNKAVDRAARDPNFLHDTLEATAKSDQAFTGRLLSMYESIYLGPNAVFQSVMLGIFRTDYMPTNETGATSEGAGWQSVLTTSAEAWKNVEINTISVSFAGLSPLVTRFHEYVQRYEMAHSEHVLLPSTVEAEAVRVGSRVVSPPPFSPNLEGGELERSPSDTEVPAALSAACAAWEASLEPVLPLLQAYLTADETAAGQQPTALLPVVLVITQEGERNTGDQYKLLLRLLEAEGRHSIRRTLQTLHHTMRLLSVRELLDGWRQHRDTAPPTHLDSAAAAAAYEALVSQPEQQSSYPPFAVIDNRYVVSVAYFRSSYTPNDFHSEDCWAAREAVERCNAVKCPSLPHHLMTWKKVQQRFTEVERVLTPYAFHGNGEEARALAAHFMAQYALSGETEGGAETTEAAKAIAEERIQEAIAHPERYVLKPQLEGGGNLYAGAEMATLLRTATLAEKPELYHKIRKEFILMRRIHFPLRRVAFFRQNTLHTAIEMSSELGLFGVILSDGKAGSGAEEEAEEEQKRWPFYLNRYAGCVIRTKPEGQDDGGVMSGIACLDSLIVVP